MFESVELSINHEQVSRKSTALDYGMSECFFQKINYDDSFVLTSLDVSGTYDPLALDASDPRVKMRFASGEKFFLDLVHENETYEVPFYRWYIIMNINHGLARESDCLPADVIVNFRFQRAPAEFSILKISDTIGCIKKSDKSSHEFPYVYTESVVPLKNPLLTAYYAFSPELESTMGRVRHQNMEISFMGKISYWNIFFDYYNFRL